VTGMPTSGTVVPGTSEPGSAARLARLVDRVETLGQTVGRISFPLLRGSLGVVFIWFGALKFTESTPVGALVAKTVPFVPPHILVPALGAFEVILGLGLLIGRRLEIVALLMCAHLTGTFLVLVTQPDVAFQNHNPLMLTMTGEFVVKNIVLITAGLLLATWRPHGSVPLAEAVAGVVAQAQALTDPTPRLEAAPAESAATS
jgi:putative oxidoreductase